MYNQSLTRLATIEILGDTKITLQLKEKICYQDPH